MARTPASPAAPAPVPMQQTIAPPPQMMPQRKVSLLEAIAAASAGFGDLVKDTKNDYLKSQYLSLPGLLRAVKPALLEHNVVIYSQVMFNTQWMIRTTLAFADGSEELSSDFPIPDPSNQQRIAAVVTFGTRYNLFALLAVCPESDDDGNSGSYAAAPVASAALPGLPGGLPGAAPLQFVQPGQMMQPYAIANPVQPLPVLPQ